MKLRTVIFWMHLPAGVIAGGIILIMSVTGALLAYEKQITTWADGYQVAPPRPGAPRLAVEALLARAREARPDATPSSLTLRADPTAPAVVQLGRESMLFLDPYTGAVLGEGSRKARAFFHEVTDWHRWLGTGADSRALGRGVTGASNLLFLFIVLSGIYLWWPDQWTRSVLKSIVLFRFGLRGKARDFNWHNVIGFWSFLPLAFVVATAVPISYPWASNLVYRLVGEEPPARPSGAGPAGPRPGGEAGGAPRRGEGEPRRGPRPEGGARPDGAARPDGDRRSPEGGRPLDLAGLDALWARAEQQVPDWQSLSLRIPSSAGAPFTFSIDTSRTGAIRPDKRSQLTLDRSTGAVVRFEPYATQSLGRRIRTWMRFIHTGEAFGIIGQAIAGVASAGAAVLVWTGLALSWRRLLAWMARRSRARIPERVPLPEGSMGGPA
jgi:uncharacterized iron-regulated membrane protein